MAATVNLWSTEEGLCLAQRRIPEASGEGPQCELLLKHLQVKGVILSGDAAYCMRTQTPVAMDVRIGLHEALFGPLYFALTVKRL